MIRLKIDNSLVLNCTIRLPDSDFKQVQQVLNSARAILNSDTHTHDKSRTQVKSERLTNYWYELNDQEKAVMQSIIRKTNPKNFTLSAFRPRTQGSSPKNLLFAKEIIDHNKRSETKNKIGDPELVNWIQKVAVDYYDESKIGKGTGNKHDNREMHTFKVPLNLLKFLGFSEEEIRQLSGKSGDQMYIKLDFNIDTPNPSNIDVTSYHRDSDSNNWDDNYRDSPEKQVELYEQTGSDGEISKKNRDISGFDKAITDPNRSEVLLGQNEDYLSPEKQARRDNYNKRRGKK